MWWRQSTRGWCLHRNPSPVHSTLQRCSHWRWAVAGMSAWHILQPQTGYTANLSRTWEAPSPTLPGDKKTEAEKRPAEGHSVSKQPSPLKEQPAVNTWGVSRATPPPRGWSHRSWITDHSLQSFKGRVAWCWNFRNYTDWKNAEELHIWVGNWKEIMILLLFTKSML